MAVRLTWAPNAEDDIASYQLERSTDAITFSALVTITHDLGDSLVYDSVNNVFFYEDPTGVANTHYYRMRAVDSALNTSAYSAPRQVGPPDPALCVVFGTVVDADGTPNTNVQVRATILSAEDTKDGQLVGNLGVTATQIEAFTDDNGFFEITLLQGAKVMLAIPKIELDAEITVPSQEAVDFKELI